MTYLEEAGKDLQIFSWQQLKSFTKLLKRQDATEHHQSNDNNFTTLPVSSDALQFIAKVNNTIALLSFEFTMF